MGKVTMISPKTMAPEDPLRVFSVIPGEAEGPQMIFAKRLVAMLSRVGVTTRAFFLSERVFPRGLTREWGRMRRELRDFQPHLLHAHYGTMTAFFCALNSGLPLVVTYHGSDLNPEPGVPKLRSWLGHFLSQMAALKARRIICVSRKLKERLRVGGNRVRIINYGFDNRSFYPQPQNAAREKLGWSQEEPIVVFNAGGRPQVKRLDLAQAAVAAARMRCGEVRFEALSGEMDPEIIPIIMNAADCLLLTSDWEGSPTVIKEALACNLPVVSVDVGDAKEMLRRDPLSRIAERDPQALGQALAEVLTRRERSQGHEIAQEFSLENTVQRILAVYREII